jgi:hypothetical protein
MIMRGPAALSNNIKAAQTMNGEETKLQLKRKTGSLLKLKSTCGRLPLGTVGHEFHFKQHKTALMLVVIAGSSKYKQQH